MTILFTHSRDIYVRILHNLKGQQSTIRYTIPIYMDRPKGIPHIEIKENEMVLRFTNLEQPQIQQVSDLSCIPSDNLCKDISSPSCQSLPLKSGSASILS